MIYNDGTEMNDEMRVEICPRCENEVMSVHAEYCKICGLRLYNYCSGETVSDPQGNYPDKIEQHKNSSNARFCEKCGNPTIYNKEELLRDWKDIKIHAEESEDDDYEGITF